MVVRSHGEAAPPALTPLAGSAPTAAGPSPEQEQLAQLLRGFLGVMEQEIGELKTSIDQLKTSQEQMVRNNSAVAEQLKAAQEMQQQPSSLKQRRNKWSATMQQPPSSLKSSAGTNGPRQCNSRRAA